jgi:cell division protein FtsQ
MVSEDEVRTAAALPLHQPLVTTDTAGARERVATLRPVASVEVSRRWPDQVVISVVERTPIAVIDIAGKFRALDRDGVVFFQYAKAPKGMPLVKTAEGTEQRALKEAAAVVSALPSELASITRYVEVKSVDQISLQLAKGRTVTWGSAEDSAEKARVLTALLTQEASSYDVSVPGQPTTRG